jgi:hypothetical protein
MNKGPLFIFLTFLTTLSLKAQVDDYVINNPNKSRSENFNSPSILDTSTIANPDYTAYFLNPTAYTLEKKKIRLSATNIFFLKGSYGLTKNAMVSVNISALGTATASLKQQLNLTNNIKLGFSASGGLLIYIPGDTTSQTRSEMVSILGGQTMITIGDKQDNITIGTGLYYIYDHSNFLTNSNQYFIANNIFIGFQKQLGRKVYLMAEGIYLSKYHAFTGALGLKFIVGDRVALNFGIMPFGWKDQATQKIDLAPIAIPLISFRMLLGRT